jgi:hypothetical protein
MKEADVRLGSPLETPANGARLFPDRNEALRQPIGSVQFAWNEKDPFLYNELYDASLICFDENYCTVVTDIQGLASVPTLNYLPNILERHLAPNPVIIDIGCGQGEFVEALRDRGLDAIGYDPVVRRSERFLHPEYWSPNEPPADLYVMRCVLPHIPEPWKFLKSISESSPNALVLVEFQRLEWILENNIWYQIGHGHVNFFSADDFECRYTVVDQGQFSNGEWAWVLIDPATFVAAPPREDSTQKQLQTLLANRKSMLWNTSKISDPVAIWGAAGKGIVLGQALQDSSIKVSAAVDANPNRWGKFLETSGIPVVSPENALKGLPTSTSVLVSNPNHLEAIQDLVQGRFNLLVPADLI